MPKKTLPVLPLRNLVVFPGVVAPVDVGRPRSLRLLEAAGQPGARLLLATQRDPDVDDPSFEDFLPVGVEAEVVKLVRVSDTRMTVFLRGSKRVRLLSVRMGEPHLLAEAEPLVDVRVDDVELQGLALAVRETAKQALTLGQENDEGVQGLELVQDPARLADVTAAQLDLPVEDKFALLEDLDVASRLRRVLAHLRHRIEVHKVKEKIDSQVRAEFSKHQREAVLRQKLKAIQEELGETDEGDDLGELEERVEQAAMPPDAEKAARKQLERLRQMPPQSAEYTVTRTYLDWLIELPWSKATEDHLDLGEARRVLDEDHYDLEKVKKRMLEYLAVRKLKPDKKGPILCLVGAPGVGKTSLGKSIARALGRQFVRISLGGVRDEAEVRGHRRTYVGALPGRLIQAMRKAGVRNPVFILDEMDKIGTDYRGDPASALLEALDPEQNHAFSDHYVEVPFDLSQVLFIGTANQLEPIPPALLDRLEVIELPGYTRSEKLQIAREHLIPKQLREHGLEERGISFLDVTVLGIVDRYTHEAGVRNLEREIAAMCRALAVKVATGEEAKLRVEEADLLPVLGPARFQAEVAERTEVPGVATGLAVTETGGEILFVEATRMASGGSKLILTGQLGDVMKESAQAALTYIRARAETYGIDPGFFEGHDIHVHVPAGAVPKDGPSAGAAVTSALVSLLTERHVMGDVAMTGEITLRGTVLPVGGIKEKVLAAHRAGIRRVVMPDQNRKDCIDIPDEIRREMTLMFVKRIDEVLDAVLEKTDSPTAAMPPRRPAPTQPSAPVGP
jgi:ATP-dependent Lon protease